MTIYNNQTLYESMAKNVNLKIPIEQTRTLWNSIWDQIAENYESGICTQIPQFANFGYNIKGQPQAVLMPAFLKTSASRFTTDQKLNGALQYVQFDSSRIQGTKIQMSHILAEVQNKMLYQVQKMQLTLGRLGIFKFDKRLRQYTFSFKKAGGYDNNDAVLTSLTRPNTQQVTKTKTTIGRSQSATAAPGVPLRNTTQNLTYEQKQQLLNKKKQGCSGGGEVLLQRTANTIGRSQSLATRSSSNQYTYGSVKQRTQPQASLRAPNTIERSKPAMRMISYGNSDRVSTISRASSVASRASSCARSTAQSRAGSRAQSKVGSRAESRVESRAGSKAQSQASEANAADLRDFDEFEQKPEPTPMSAGLFEHTNLFQKTINPPRLLGYQTNNGYSQDTREYLEKLRQDEVERFNTLKQEEVRRALSEQPREVIYEHVCRKCLYDAEVERKRLEKLRARQEEKDYYNAMCDVDHEIYQNREKRDRQRHYENQAINHAYNKRVAEEKYQRELAYKRAGHFHKEGEIQPNTAVLQDDPTLSARIRAKNVSYLQDQLDQDRERKRQQQLRDDKLIDFIERRRHERAVKAEKQAEQEFKRKQQKALRDEIAYYDKHPKLVRPLVTAPMTCEQLLAGTYDNGYITETLHRNNMDRLQRENQHDAEANKIRDKEMRSQSLQLDRQQLKRATAGLEQERRERLQKKLRTQRDLQKTYEEQIRDRLDKIKREKENSRQDLNTFRFRDEVIPICRCGRCGRSYRYDNVFVQHM